jgi:hypothetical protein
MTTHHTIRIWPARICWGDQTETWLSFSKVIVIQSIGEINDAGSLTADGTGIGITVADPPFHNRPITLERSICRGICNNLGITGQLTTDSQGIVASGTVSPNAYRTMSP